MSAEIKKEIPLEIAHVLFMDIVGYSRLLIDDQHEVLQRLNQIVRSTDQFRSAEADGKLVRLPTGDGMALVFFSNPEAPVQCAMEISKAIKRDPKLQLRMGIHSGAVSGVNDVNDRSNVAGAGINLAQRVMDCGDSGHILLSKRAAEDLTQYSRWHPYLHDLGEREVKHGVVVSLVNLYTKELGNPKLPEGLKQRKQNQAARIRGIQPAISGTKRAIGIIVLFLLFALMMLWLTQMQRRQAAVIQKQGEQVTAIVGRYEKMEQALVRLAQVETQSKPPGSKMSPEEQRAAAYSTLEKDLGLPAASLAKELPAFALELYHRADTTSLMRARAAYALNKFDEAEKLSLEGAARDRQAYETAQRVEEDQRKRAIESYLLAGQSAQKRIQYTDAMEHFREAEKLTDRERNPADWARVQHAIGDVLLDQGTYKEAETVLRRVVDVRSHVLGAENPDTLTTRNRLDNALRAEGNYTEAEGDFRELIKLQEKVRGPEHPDTLSSRTGHAVVLEEQGKYMEAAAELQAIVTIENRILGPEHPQTLSTRNNYAIVLYEEGKYHDAETEDRQVLGLKEKVFGPEHPETSKTRNSLAIVLADEGRYAEAEAEFRRLLEIDEKTLGPRHPGTASSHSNLGLMLEKEGKYQEAEAEHRIALNIREKVLGAEHPETLTTHDNIGSVLDSEGKYAQAEAELRAAVKLEEKVLGQENPDTIDARYDLGRTLTHEGKYEEGATELRAALKSYEKVVGPEHPSTLRTRHSLAVALDGVGNYSEGETDLREVIRLQEKSMGFAHPDTLDSCYDLALTLKDENKLQEAKESAERAVEGARKVLGPQHPLTEKYEKLLADLEAKR